MITTGPYFYDSVQGILLPMGHNTFLRICFKRKPSCDLEAGSASAIKLYQKPLIFLHYLEG